MTLTLCIFGITRDNGYASDPDAAIDKYYYHEFINKAYLGDFCSLRQDLVDKVRAGSIAYTYPNGHIGARCEVKVSPNGVEYLKSIPDGNPENNISALPEM